MSACLAVGVEPRYREYAGDDPLGFVISLNLNRRHLNESQRAVIAARLANMKRTDNLKQYRSEGSIDPSEEMSIEQAAKLLNVGRATVVRAKAVEREAPDAAELHSFTRFTRFTRYPPSIFLSNPWYVRGSRYVRLP